MEIKNEIVPILGGIRGTLFDSILMTSENRTRLTHLRMRRSESMNRTTPTEMENMTINAKARSKFSDTEKVKDM